MEQDDSVQSVKRSGIEKVTIMDEKLSTKDHKILMNENIIKSEKITELADELQQTIFGTGQRSLKYQISLTDKI